MTDSATSALLEDDDEETGEDLGGLDDLLAPQTLAGGVERGDG